MIGRAQNLVRGTHHFKTLERCWLSRSLQLMHYYCEKGGQRRPETDGKRDQTSDKWTSPKSRHASG